MRKIREVFENLKRVKKWVPVIWKDRDWDHYYFEQIVIFKLKSMEDYFLNHGVTTTSEQCAKEMREVINFLEKTEEEYEKEIYPDQEELYEGFESNIFKQKTELSPKEKEQDETRYKVWEEASCRFLQNKKKAFIIISEKLLSWWD